MGNYVDRTRKKLIILGIIVIALIWHNFGPVYKCKNVDKKSEWYVNDIYMSDQYYYNNLLHTNEQEAYKVMLENIKNIKESFVVDLRPSEVEKVWNALICDHPELINLSLYRYSSTGKTTKIMPIYITTSKVKLRSMERKVRREIGKVVRKAKGKSDFEKEKIVYEYLGKNNAYGFTYKNSDQSAYTVFTFSNTVCAGYGKAAQLLLSNCGVKSMININSNHIWNTVELDGEYYFFDATCSGVFYRNLDGVYEHVSYMGLNQNQNTSSYEILYPRLLPDVSGEKYNYYDYMGLTLTYDENDLSNIKKYIDKSKYRMVEIKFTNYAEAEAGIARHLSELGLENVYHYTGYTEGNQVITMKKKK